MSSDKSSQSSTTTAARTEGPGTTVILQQSTPSLVQRIVSGLGWTGFILCAISLVSMNLRLSDYFNTTSGLTEKYVSGEKYGKDKVAIITISGVIMEGDGFVKKQIDRVKEDKNVKAVVVRVDSPGGTVTGSDYMLHHLNKLRTEKKIPIVVSMGSIAASGGYYVAMSVGDEPKSIYAEPTTITGSIGVMMPHYDVSGLLDELHVKDDSIASHERKLMLNMTKPLTPEHRAIVQGTINQMFERFKEIIKDGRPVFRKDPEALDELATGEVFLADSAKKFGLIDEIGFQEDAIERALELAGLEASKARVVKYERPSSLLDAVGYGSAQAPPWHSAESLFDMTTPRAYYLYSTFPALASSLK
jgi:protease-4